MNKKGFTLVELLAVIVILAILMLLAFPQVLRIMQKAKKNSFKNETLAIIRAAELKYTSQVQMDRLLQNVTIIMKKMI